MKNYTNSDSQWDKNTHLIKDFLASQKVYEQLGLEIAYIIRKRIEDQSIEFSTITSRQKTLNSFLGKISRKKYNTPLTEITDFSGVRLVYLYQGDFKRIEKIIKSEFEVLEKVDKLNEREPDRFGYGAVHYILKLGKKTIGARYEDLKDLVCEVQIRTVLQDAWAIIDHHMVYKKESEIPTSLQRKLNGLAGLFETADNQFEHIRNEREYYLKELNESKSSKSFLENEFNLDTFTSYLSWKFPDMAPKLFDLQIEAVFNDVNKLNFESLRDLDIIIEKYKKRWADIITIFQKEFGRVYLDDMPLPSSLLISAIFLIDDKDYLKLAEIPDEIKEYVINNLKKLNL